MSDEVSTIRNRAQTVREAGTALAAARVTERAAWLDAAARTLERQVCESSDELAASTGLSVPMVKWAAQTTLDTVREDALLSLADRAFEERMGPARPLELLSVILAGNVFTASVRATFVPLLLGAPVLTKVSSKETLFPSMLRAALRSTDRQLGAAIDLVSFPGGDADREAALIDRAEAVSVYGSDDTIAAIASKIGDVALLAHGHGVSVAYCGSEALLGAQIERTSSSLSLDICAYDQRGCLSPQLVFVEETPRRSALELARHISEGELLDVGETLPRGPLPLTVGAEQAQWRGIAEIEGKLVCGDQHAIAVRTVPPVRWSPGYRNITFAPVSGIDEAFEAMLSFARHLKCVGADEGSRAEIEARLEQSASFCAYACPLGQMQTPSLDAPADGRNVWHGLLRD